MNSVWIFNGSGRKFPNFPSAVFSTVELAEVWITKNSCNGVLTQYPLDRSVYDWAIDSGQFRPKNVEQQMPKFIESFSSASQEHYHYENGERNPIVGLTESS